MEKPGHSRDWPIEEWNGVCLRQTSNIYLTNMFLILVLISLPQSPTGSGQADRSQNVSISLYPRELFISIHLGYVRNKVYQATTVGILVVVPGNQFNKVIVEGDSGFSIEDRRMSIAYQVLRHDLVFSVTKNT